MADSEEDIIRRINDFTTGKALAESAINSNPNHAFYEDMLRTIKHCEDNLILLNTELKKLREVKCQGREENPG